MPVSAAPPRTAPDDRAGSPAASPPPTGTAHQAAPAPHHDRQRLRPRHRHVEPVGAQEERRAARRLVQRRGAERDDDRPAPPGPGTCPPTRSGYRGSSRLRRQRTCRLNGRDDQDVLRRHRRARRLHCPPPAAEQLVDDRRDGVALLVARLGAAVMLTGTQTMPVSAGTSPVPGPQSHPVPGGLRDALEPAVVDRLGDEPADVRVHPHGRRGRCRDPGGRWPGRGARTRGRRVRSRPGGCPWVTWESCIWSPTGSGSGPRARPRPRWRGRTAPPRRSPRGRTDRSALPGRRATRCRRPGRVPGRVAGPTSSFSSTGAAPPADQRIFLLLADLVESRRPPLATSASRPPPSGSG